MSGRPPSLAGPSKHWRRAPRRWVHPLHSLCTYFAMSPPQAPRVLIRWLTKPGDVVYDPFAGRGTAPLEACRMGRVGLGSYANPPKRVIDPGGARGEPREGARSWLSKRTTAAIDQLRASHEFLRDEPAPLTQGPDGAVKWWTFAGGLGKLLLAAALQARLGEKDPAGNEAVRFSGDAAKSDVAIRRVLRELADGPRLTWTDAASWTDVGANVRVSKFQQCLPERVEQEFVARALMDVSDGTKTLRVWRGREGANVPRSCSEP